MYRLEIYTLTNATREYLWTYYLFPTAKNRLMLRIAIVEPQGKCDDPYCVNNRYPEPTIVMVCLARYNSMRIGIFRSLDSYQNQSTAYDAHLENETVPL